MHGNFSWSMFCLHLLKGSKVCKSAFLRNRTKEVWPWKTPSKMGQLHGPSCKLTPHTWDLRLGAMCEVVSPTFHALNGWDSTNWPQANCSRQTGDLGPLHTWDWEPMTITLQALSLVENVGPVQVHFTLRLRDQRSMWMQDGCKVYMDSYMTSNGSCCMVTWIIFKNHLLEVGLTQNRKTKTLQAVMSIVLFYFIIYEDPHK
jgi:hypothetical protein